MGIYLPFSKARQIRVKSDFAEQNPFSSLDVPSRIDETIRMRASEGPLGPLCTGTGPHWKIPGGGRDFFARRDIKPGADYGRCWSSSFRKLTRSEISSSFSDGVPTFKLLARWHILVSLLVSLAANSMEFKVRPLARNTGPYTVPSPCWPWQLPQPFRR